MRFTVQGPGFRCRSNAHTGEPSGKSNGRLNRLFDRKLGMERCIGVGTQLLFLETIGNILGYMGIMGKKMETTILAYIVIVGRGLNNPKPSTLNPKL